MPAIRHRNTALSLLTILVVTVLLAGCTARSRIQNAPSTETVTLERFDVERQADRSEDIWLFLAFSGGGTRAAAFSYGVLEELRDTRYSRNGNERRLLDEVDIISSVSGGSFTAAYYGLFGERIFDDYQDVFLKKMSRKS